MLNEKKEVRVSLCKSNVKKDTYYGRVSKVGKLSEKDLINKVKEKAPYIDLHNLKIGFEVLSEIILESVEEGYEVDLFGLGTVGLKTKGSLKVSEPIKRNIEGAFEKIDETAEDSTNTDEVSDEKELTSVSKNSVEFSIQFSASRQVKKHIKDYVYPSVIIAKVRKPKIESIERVGGEKDFSIIKVKGDGLKLVGEGRGLYIRKKDKIIEIPPEAMLQNEPKMLMFVLNEALNDDYMLYLSTQYAKMGNRQTSIIRRCVKEFSFRGVESCSLKQAS